MYNRNEVLMIDTHVHFNVDPLYDNYPDLIEKAMDAGVSHFILIGFDYETIERGFEIASLYDNVFLACGFHPTIADTITEDDFLQLETWLDHPKVVAVGECGIDLHWKKETLEIQKDVFTRQLELAKKKELPVVIHMRDATQETLNVLNAHGPLKGVMHCYSGSLESLQAFLDLGLHIGLDGPVTFKNAVTPKEVAKAVPLEKLLLETDAPFLTPHPHRGKPNSSHYLPLICDAIAAIKEVSSKTIEDATTHNAKQLFNIDI